VTNAWGRTITVQVSAARDTPLDQRRTLGEVAVGATVRFHNALPPDQPEYVFHARYDDNRYEFLTLCHTRAALAERGWWVTIPEGGTCAPPLVTLPPLPS
jgi:hypothetical protein